MARSERFFCYPDSVVPGRRHLGIGLMAVAIAAAAMRAVPDEPRGGHGRHGLQGHRATAAQRPRRQTAGNREDKGG